MTFTWAREERPRWDDVKQRVIGGAPPGALDLDPLASGSSLPGDWWSVTDPAGDVVGYGWLDSTWGGDAEILLAVAPDAQGRGVGSFVLDRLEAEAAQRGMNYVYNTVRASHPDRDRVHDWLAVRGYRGSDSDAALRKRVEVQGRPSRAGAARPVQGSAVQGSAAQGSAVQGSAGQGSAVQGSAVQGSAVQGSAAQGTARPPGDEESGGYVDVDEHQY